MLNMRATQWVRSGGGEGRSPAPGTARSALSANMSETLAGPDITVEGERSNPWRNAGRQPECNKNYPLPRGLDKGATRRPAGPSSRIQKWPRSQAVGSFRRSTSCASSRRRTLARRPAKWDSFYGARARVLVASPNTDHNLPGRGVPQAPAGLLSRVHLSIQSPGVALARIAVSTSPQRRCGRCSAFPLADSRSSRCQDSTASSGVTHGCHSKLAPRPPSFTT